MKQENQHTELRTLPKMTVFKWKIQDSNLFEYGTPFLLKKGIWLLLLLLLFHSVMSNSLHSHRQQHTSLPCPSLSPRACSNSCLLCRWCNRVILCCPLLLPSVFPSIRVLYLLPIIYASLWFPQTQLSINMITFSFSLLRVIFEA